jgi:geranylgeranyl transferase type-2 subunit beta
MSDYLRMSGLYWSVTFLDLTHSIEKFDKNEIVEFIKRNQHESGGFRPCDGHEAHLLYTLSALQVCFKNSLLTVTLIFFD